MKYPNSIEAHDLQFKIDAKFHEIKKRKCHEIKASAQTKRHCKVMQKIRWHAVKGHIQQLQTPHKNIVKVVGPPLQDAHLLDIINRLMLLQKNIMQLSKDVSNYKRGQMLCIFIQCSISIVFNSYNLVVFLLKMANPADDVPLPLLMLLFFYGYHIISSMTHIIISVLVHSGLYSSIRRTASKLDQLNMYILESTINSRISQFSAYIFNNLSTFNLFGLYNIDGTLIRSTISGTATYIIILIQYSDDGEIYKTAEHMKTNDTQSPK